jgi:anti-sigma factor RsiW
MTISGVQEWAASFVSACPDDETLAAYLDGRLLRIERWRLEAHLAGCGRCVELLATLAPDLGRIWRRGDGAGLCRAGTSGARPGATPDG